jgi:ATP-binding cassette subfamily B protein
MGFFSSLSSEGYDRQYTDRELLSRMTRYFKPHLVKVLIIIILLLVIALSGAAMPLIVSKGIDALSSNLTPIAIGLLCTAVLLAGVIRWAANWGRRRLTVRVVGDIVLTLRTDAFNAAVEHDLSFYDQFSSGKVVSRITSDTREFGQVVVLVTDLFAQLVQAIVLGVVLFTIDTRLTLMLFALLPIIFVVALSFRKLARKVTRSGMRAMAEVNATIKETVSGISVAKNFRQEYTIYDEFSRANNQSYRVNVQRGLVLSTIFPTLNGLSGVATAFLVYIGGVSVIDGLITVGAWYLFLQSLDRFFFPVLNLSSFWAQLQSGLSASERVFALMDAESKVLQVDDKRITNIDGKIQFEDVSFQYTENELVLDNFNLKINPGESIALVGRTGAGKSSIAKLIERFYEFQKGNIYVDNFDIRTLNLDAYRKQLGIVTQTPFLFSGTVEDNICYACPSDVDKNNIENLSKQIGGGEWLDALANGFDTEVGERGGRLSMGQRQLVSLMRVLVQRPAIFILDEATASIDPFTEWQIQQALNMVLSTTTSILIAHRLSTIKASDRIIVLDEGKIIETGTHDELLELGGHYATLYNTYFRHQSLAYVEKAKLLAEEYELDN